MLLGLPIHGGRFKVVFPALFEKKVELGSCRENGSRDQTILIESVIETDTKEL